MRSLPRFFLIVIAVAALFLFTQARRFSQAQGVVPAGVTLAGIAVPGRAADEVAVALTAAFQQPVAVYYAEQRVILRPESIAFKVDTRAMLKEAEQYRGGWYFVAAFLGDLIGNPTPVTDVPLRYTVDEAALNRWLTDLASRYDRPPRPPQVLVGDLSFSPGEPGLQLDVKASLPLVRQALGAIGERRADLVLVKKPAPAPTLAVLDELFKAQADEFPGVVSIFLRDVVRNEEVGVDPEVAFAGMSTMKIPIIIETYRRLDGPPDAELTKLLSETISLSGNYTANLLLAFIGKGKAEQGARSVTDMVRRLGLRNTFMAAPYDWKQPVQTPSTPANSRRDVTTYPDPFMQTTAKDMALLMEMILQCSEGEGALLAAFPNDLTSAECQEMV
ncbi:MAG: serine hydrolase, partial [Anaerolineae bacterium]|nr:serine hydrolase [Anaerolineae bacterium]